MGSEAVADAARLVELAGRLDRCTVDGFGVDFVSWGFYRPNVWRNYWHTHSFYEVCLAYAGAGTFDVGDQHWSIDAGTVFVARPGDLHQIIADPTAPLGIAFWGFTLVPGRGATPARPGWWSGLTRTDRPYVSDQLGRLPAVLTDLTAELDRPRSGQQATLQSLGARLVVETARSFADEDDLAIESPAEDRPSVLVSVMERYLLDNLALPISVRDVAAEVHLSQRHAERLYSAQTGDTLMGALRRFRLEHAADLLLNGDQSVTEIARRCGYPQPRPFITAFGRQYGQPPRSFRRNGGTLHLRDDSGA
ncbi:AraC family transcriptional regulator [Microlunatus soli]|uniref:AraC-type DNA-binding protein n=1 Tax=Microlunatus soli TaxID=630515 RepID=A0A1H1VPB5_9ACTN|nr:AraC family transcriptional regulator [Microlunatus soli]SDS86251.1 AraC-type DNA-binding protein [Microlunatus soli]